MAGPDDTDRPAGLTLDDFFTESVVYGYSPETKAAADAARRRDFDADALLPALRDTSGDDHSMGAIQMEDLHYREVPAFWTTLNAVYDPKLQFRFKVTVEGLKFEDKPGKAPPDDFNDNIDRDNGVAWYAKSVDKPGLIFKMLDQDRIVMQGGEKQTQPTVESPDYKPINMVLVDPTYPNVTRKIIRWIRRSGLHEAQAQQIISDAKKTRKKSFLDTIGPVTIEQLAPNGKWLERWTLHGAFPADISFGKLDYSSNDLVEINMTWYYTSFTVEFSGFNPKDSSTLGAGPIGKEDYYDYFRGDDTVPPTPPKETPASCAERWRLLGPAGQAVWKSQGGYGGYAKSACGITVAAPPAEGSGTGGDHAGGTADLSDTDEVPPAQADADANKLADLRQSLGNPPWLEDVR